MSFWSNPGKAIRGAVSKYVPGESYLTGDAARRQKFHYDAALARYNSYATAAQNQISAMTQSLKQSAQQLQSLEQQQTQHSLAGQSLNAEAGEYASLLASFENAREAANKEAGELEKAALTFKAKAPELTRQDQRGRETAKGICRAL